MAGQVIELNPVSHITTGFVGQPGKRVFYLQASKGVQVVSVILEKLQVEALAEGVEQFLRDLKERHAELAEPEVSYRAERMAHKLPLDLALLPILESGYEPRAVSPKLASGIWQFSPSRAVKPEKRLTRSFAIITVLRPFWIRLSAHQPFDGISPGDEAPAAWLESVPAA